MTLIPHEVSVILLFAIVVCSCMGKKQYADLARNEKRLAS